MCEQDWGFKLFQASDSERLQSTFQPLSLQILDRLLQFINKDVRVLEKVYPAQCRPLQRTFAVGP